MEKITPFDIPLLNNEICQYLSRKDLTRCVLVSKTWASQFSPVLWRDLDCSNKTPGILAFTRQQDYIRTVCNIRIECNSIIREQLASLPLQRLEFDERSSGILRKQMRVMSVLERIPTLQHLKISLSLDYSTIHQQWIRTLEALPGLESLTLTCRRLMNGMALQKVLQACRGLRYLSVTLTGYDDELEEEDRQEYKEAREAIRSMPPMRLCELFFNSFADVVQENILQPLLERCPSMEKLHIVDVRSGLTLEHLTKTLKENKLPELRHLALGAHRLGDGIGDVLEVVLHNIVCGLDSFVLEDQNGDLAAPPIIHHQSRSLTRLEMLDTPISPWTLSDLMAGLPCLRIVKVEIDENAYGYRDHRRLNKDWKCVDLRSLELDFGSVDVYFDFDDNGWKDSVEKMCMDHVFSQVGKLTSLQELNLECEQDMYRKGHGYLEQLTGLKQLKVLDLTDTDYKKLGKQEASWMAENWPKLLQVSPDHLPAVFKKTLLRKRPLVEFIKG
ncbi:hypothetical protein BGX34_006317, partial [Mortierella sp. NVP85]